MRIFATALLACVITTAASVAATDYWAFGDSITRGEGGGFNLDPDPGSSTDCLAASPYPTKCGYHWRLEDALTTLAGIDNDVLNRGVAGETTGTGISRIDEAGEPLSASRCTDPDAGDVLLLMEGTNDISGAISTTTIKANLGIMIGKATTKCVHSVIASTVRRLMAGTALGSKEGDPGHLPTSLLTTKIVALAGEKNRAYVDVWSPLCPDQPCYGFTQPPTTNFWGRLGAGDPGHVSYLGYDVMAPLFEAAILADPLPDAVTPLGPSGDSMNTTPTFSWNEDVNSDWYFLEVDGGVSYQRWHPEEEEQTPGVNICTGGVCTFDPGVALADGDHTWRVRTRNLRGVGSWSPTSSFGVWTAPPGATTLVYPDHDIFDTMPTTPVYRWTAIANATEYDLVVDNVSQGIYQATTVCSGGLCSTTPATALMLGPHSWSVQTANPLFPGPTSSVIAFDVLACDLPVDVDLPDPGEVNEIVNEQACEDLSAVNGYVVGATGVVTFHAGVSIALGDGFSVLTGGTFTARVDY